MISMDPIYKIIASCSKCHSMGVNYDVRRCENYRFSRKYLPEKVKVLWIVESPPLSDPPRYFYRPKLTKFDGLFREIMKVLGLPVIDPKNKSLHQFAEMGHFLIDAMKCPADKLNSHLKSAMQKSCVSLLAAEIIELDPEKILIIKADNYAPVFDTVVSVGMGERVLNKTLIPFPGSGQQVRFRNEVHKYLNRNSLVVK